MASVLALLSTGKGHPYGWRTRGQRGHGENLVEGLSIVAEDCVSTTLRLNARLQEPGRFVPKRVDGETEVLPYPELPVYLGFRLNTHA